MMRCRRVGGYGALVSAAFTIFWRQDRWKRALTVHRPLEVLFGGPHLSEPSFRRAAVRAGDLLYPVGVDRQVLHVVGRMQVGQIRAVDQAQLQEQFDRFPLWRFLASTCTDEVVLGLEGTDPCAHRAVPGEVLKTLTYMPRRGTRPIKHVTDDGLLTKVISVQGIHRLSPDSADDLDTVLAASPTKPSAVADAQSPGGDALF